MSTLFLFSLYKEGILKSASHLPHWLGVFSVSMLPIFELRGGIPFGINVLHMPYWKVYPIAVFGNILPIIPVILILHYISKLSIVKRFLKRTELKGHLVKRYGLLGLMLFVAIPLPITGAWTGSALAFIFSIPWYSALLAITGGVLIAGIIVTILSLMGITGAIIATIAFIIVMILPYIKKRRFFPILLLLFLLFGGCTRAQIKHKQLLIGKIQFNGNNTFSEKILKSIMRSKKGTPYNENYIREDIKRIVQYYSDHGFFDAKIMERSGKIDRKRGRLNYTFTIMEGNRYKVSDILLEGNKFLSNEEIKKNIPFQIGMYYNAGLINISEYKITNLYARYGFINMRLNVKTKRLSDSVKIIYYIQEKDRVRLRNIIFKNLGYVKENTIKNEITLKKGDFLNLTEAYHTQRNLYNTALFKYVHFDILPVSNNSADIKFQVNVEKPKWVGIGFGYNSPNKLLLTADWGDNYFLGAVRRIHTGFDFSFNLEKEMWADVRAGYQELHFSPLGLSQNGSFLYRWVKTNGYYESSYMLKFELTKSMLDIYHLSLSYNFRHTTIETLAQGAVIEDTMPASITNSLVFQLFVDKRNDFIYPTSGQYWTISGEYAGGIFRGNNHFKRIIAQENYYKKMPGEGVIASRIRLGITFPDMPPEMISPDVRFELGGASSIRGYDESSIGERDIRGKMSGIEMILGNFEVRLRFKKKIIGILFVDTGNLWMNFAGPFSLKVSSGFGIGYLTNFGIFRLDYGRKLTDVSPTDRGKIYFNIGNPF